MKAIAIVEEHAKLSPSGATKWLNCAGSLAMEYGRPDDGNEYSREGTAAHAVAAHCQEQRIPTAALVGTTFKYVDHGEAREIVVTEEMAEYLQVYIDAVKTIAGRGRLYVEQRLEFSHYVGIPNQFGTSDDVAVLYVKRELQIHDLKYGRGVKVEAEENSQLKIYALGAYRKFAPRGDEFDTVRLVIHQPRLEHISEWVLSVEDLLAFAVTMRVGAEKAMLLLDVGASESDLLPGEDQCRFCKAKPDCKALARASVEAAGADFNDLDNPPDIVHISDGLLSDDEVSRLNKLVGMVKMWCIAIDQQLYMRLMAGAPIEGFKLVMGKQGPRNWRDPDDAAAIMEGHNVEESVLYKRSLISPTEAEKLLSRNHPEVWADLSTEIVRSSPSLTVAEEKDKRSRAGRAAAMDDFADLDDLPAKPRKKTLKRDRAKNTAITDFDALDEGDF